MTEYTNLLGEPDLEKLFEVVNGVLNRLDRLEAALIMNKPLLTFYTINYWRRRACLSFRMKYDLRLYLAENNILLAEEEWAAVKEGEAYAKESEAAMPLEWYQ